MGFKTPRPFSGFIVTNATDDDSTVCCRVEMQPVLEVK